MFAAVWINKFAHAQWHRERLAESLKNLADDSKESVLNKNRFSIPIPIHYTLPEMENSCWLLKISNMYCSFKKAQKL